MNSSEMWTISDHVCRHCLGRVLVQEQGLDVRVRCAECGAEAWGPPAVLCACGVKLHTGRNAGLRCRPNRARSPEAPQQIVVEYETGDGSSPLRTPTRVADAGAANRS